MKRRSFLQLTGASALSARLPLQSPPEIIVIGAGGGSGHGFKHGPAFGQYLANRLLGRRSEPDFDQAFTLKKETF